MWLQLLSLMETELVQVEMTYAFLCDESGECVGRSLNEAVGDIAIGNILLLPKASGQCRKCVEQFDMTSESLQKLLGSNIDRVRKQQSMTVEKLAEAAKASPGHLYDVIHGRKWVSSDLLVRLSEVLAISPSALLQQPDSPHLSAEVAVSALGSDLAGKIESLVAETTKTHLAKLNR